MNIEQFSQALNASEDAELEALVELRRDEHVQPIIEATADFLVWAEWMP